MVLPIMDADASRLLDFAGGRGDADASGATNGLMLHLLLTQPKAADEPSPENDGWHDRWVDVAADKASERWAAVAGDSATTRARRTIENTMQVLHGPRQPPAATWSNGTRASFPGCARRCCRRNQGDPLADLLRDPNMPRDVRLIDVAGGAVTVFQSTATAKTRAVGAGRVHAGRMEGRQGSDRADDGGSGAGAGRERWLLGRPARRRQAADAAAMRAGYFRRYVDAWRAFLLSLSVQAPTSIDEARSLVKALVTERPLDAVWRNAAKNLVFKDDSSDLGRDQQGQGWPHAEGQEEGHGRRREGWRGPGDAAPAPAVKKGERKQRR